MAGARQPLHALVRALASCSTRCDLRAFGSAACGLSTIAADPDRRAPRGDAAGQLLAHIKAKIMVRGGPISLAEYMQDCLTSPQGGFYMSRDVFGSAGDFVTSPEISQLFGEMIGIWCVHTWMAMGQPPRLQLVELGPGRGTLMADLLRGTAAFRGFAAALEVHMVELSPALRAMQWRALRCEPPPPPPQAQQQAGDADLQYLRAGLPPLVRGGAAGGGGGGSSSGSSNSGSSSAAPSPGGGGSGGYTTPDAGISGFNSCRVHWHPALESVPDGPAPALYVAHEFFDALPVHQFVRDPARGWLEKMIDVQHSDEHEQPAGSSTAAASSNSGTNSGASSSTSSTSSSAEARPGPSAAAESVSACAPRGTARGAIQRDGGDAPEGSTSGAGLRLVLSPAPTPAAALLVPRRLAAMSEGEAAATTAIEVCAVGMATAEKLAGRIGRHGGAALVVDYGREGPYEDSLMAIRAHRGVGILDRPGTADLSAWVDFGALKVGAASPGGPVSTSGPVSQAAFLRALGVEARLQRLCSRAASPAQAETLAAGCARLLDEGESGMGRTYGVMALHHEGLKGQLAGLA